MCTTPKLLYIPDSQGNVHQTFTACGHCPECENVKRAQTVLRIKTELHSEKTKSCYFFTLQYNNENLHYYKDNPSARYQAIRKQMQKEDELERNWDHFILSKKDASKFLKDLQKSVKQYDKKYLARYYLIAEFGSITYRPHMHVLIFFPIPLKLGDAKILVDRIWRKGEVIVRHVCDANINYTAHHQLKEEYGTPWQQQNSPAFHITSRYHGGIGYDLLKDPYLVRNYEIGKKIVKNGKYTILIPRFAIRKLHPDKLTDQELKELSDNSIYNYAEKIRVQNRTMLDPNAMQVQYYKILSENQKIVNEQKRQYVAHRRRVKLSRLKTRNYIINFKRSQKNEHF